MKKSSVISTICVLATMFASSFVVSCQNDIAMPGTDNEAISYDDSIICFIKQAKPVLAKGIDVTDIGMTVDGYEKLLINNLSNKFSRNISSDESFIDTDSVIEIIEKEIDSFDLPNFEKLKDNDFSRIEKDYPELSRSDIENNIDMIFIIYQEQIGSIALKTLVEQIEVVPTCYSRSGYSDKIKKLYNDNKDKLTPYTVAAIMKHALSAPSLKKATEKSIELSIRYMGDGNAGDTKKDTFRHSIWNVSLANEGVGGCKERLAWAKDLTTAYEKGTLYTKKTSEMDLHNNAVGRDVYSSLTSKWHHKADYNKACDKLKQKADSAIFIDINYDFSQVVNLIDSTSSSDLVYLRK